MPAGLSHYLLAQRVAEEFQAQNKNCSAGAVLLGAQAPDFLYLYKFWRPSEPNLGVYVHRHNTRAVFESFRRHAENAVQDSFVYGYLSHYAFDVTMHPYVYWLESQYLAEEDRKKKSKFHFQIEADIDVFLYRKMRGGMDFGFAFAEEGELPKAERAEAFRLLKQMFSEVFHVTAEIQKFQRTWNDYKRVNRIKSDPGFWKRKVLRTAENVLHLKHSSSMLLQREDPDERVLNLGHRVWGNPFDVDARSEEDVYQLFDRARALTLRLAEKFDRGEIDEEFDLHLLQATKTQLFP